MQMAKNIIIIILGFILVSVAYTFVKKRAPIEVPTVQNMPSETGEPVPAVLTAAIGQQVSAGTVMLMPTAVLEDSRCPVNARCIWAGQVRIQVVVTSGAVQQLVEYTLGTPVTVLGKTVTLVSVRPETVAGSSIPSAAYEFDFEVK